ncbi:MAG: LCP family protein [Lachnospiraceae bacterium]|nr:LCP family protein [Lachnospiraceae bacterium]
MATERSSRNTGSANRTGTTRRNSSTNRTGSTQRTGSSNGRRRVSKAELKRRQRKKWIILGVEFFVFLVLIIALYFITKLDVIHKDYIDENEIQINENSNTEEMLEEFMISEEDVKFNDFGDDMKGYRNIALFGVDARNNNLGKGVRSDTIIIASINEETKEIRLASIYRDTYLNLGNDTYNKANSAYAYGGPKQAINMLNMNFDLNITDYVTVGWGAVADTVDALGGIEIDVDSAEITHLNNYQVETSQSLGRKYTKLTQTGMVNLDGIQAVSYCRIRYTAGDDYKRAERQREVIQALADKAQAVALKNPATLNDIANDVFPSTATSLTLNEILSLLSDIGSYKIVDSTGFPNEQYRATGVVGGKGDCVIPSDLSTNVTLLHEFLFGDTGYVPSAEVQNYSAKIHSDTGK